MVLACYSTIYYLYAYILGSPDEEGGNDSSYFNYIQLQAAAPPCVKHGVAARRRRKPLEFAHSLVLKERGRRSVVEQTLLLFYFSDCLLDM